jgi:very-short-patch-repair endonuclease
VIDHFIADFSCHKASLVVEVEGGVHLQQQAHDREHELFLKDIGLRVLRCANTDVEHSLEAILNAILETCQQREAAWEADGSMVS